MSVCVSLVFWLVGKAKELRDVASENNSYYLSLVYSNVKVCMVKGIQMEGQSRWVCHSNARICMVKGVQYWVGDQDRPP